MMFGELNASGYAYNNTFYNTEFELVLSKIIQCYQLMINRDTTLDNDENLIRDHLYLNYLNDNTIRREIGLKDYYFDREIQEDRTNGRTDIRVLSSYSFEDTDAYYILECKRLNSVNTNGKTGLNGEYVKNGICRFTSKTYSTYYKTNGMIGFIVDSVDILQNINCINQLIANQHETNTTSNIQFRGIIPDFDYSYCSKHTIENENIMLYHLMFNFSKNIKLN
ncbi:hypothetical protein F0358_14180 [Empedobacter brevis]|uniref:hypothetical protein n=1 Tax=Empedobacter brevis TaxID=247 RepID=UPI00123DA74F|nr:hypothetical protein [Empedobacter brevis]QES93787.1 hypothetical protein F0358_14180 [Empedobacter brevis]